MNDNAGQGIPPEEASPGDGTTGTGEEATAENDPIAEELARLRKKEGELDKQSTNFNQKISAMGEENAKLKEALAAREQQLQQSQQRGQVTPTNDYAVYDDYATEPSQPAEKALAARLQQLESQIKAEREENKLYQGAVNQLVQERAMTAN